MAIQNDDVRHDDAALHDDDRQIGRILSRREALLLLAGGAVLLPACRSGSSSSAARSVTSTTAASSPASTTATTTAATTVAAPSCVVKPALTEGPYFVDEKINRSDIRTDPTDGTTKPGALLKLAFRVYRVSSSGCTALTGATVDVWHCDAGGLYSDESANNTVGKKFLRGYQTVDANGAANFTTVYPGAYTGRNVHIHFKIRTSQGETFTSQLFFDDAFTDKVYASAPYKSGSRTLNSQDSIFSDSKGMLTLDVKQDGQGYTAAFDIGLQA